MPLSYKIAPNMDTPLMANDLYHLIKSHDIRGIEALIAREPRFLTVPAAYSNGIPVPIIAILIEENDLALVQTFIRLELPELDEIATVSMDLLLDLEMLKPEIAIELLLIPAKKDPTLYAQTILRIFAFIHQYQKFDCLPPLLQVPNARKAIFSDFALFKQIVVMLQTDLTYFPSLLEHLHTMDNLREFDAKLIENGISLLRMATQTKDADQVEKLLTLKVANQDGGSVVTIFTALFIAIRDRSDEIVSLLLAFGTSTDQILHLTSPAVGFSPMAYAMYKKNFKAFTLIQIYKREMEILSELDHCTRIIHGPFKSLLTIEGALFAKDDHAITVYFPTDLSKLALIFPPLPPHLQAAILATDSIESRNIKNFALYAILNLHHSLLTKILAIPQHNKKIMLEMLPFYFAACTTMCNTQAWEIIEPALTQQQIALPATLTADVLISVVDQFEDADDIDSIEKLHCLLDKIWPFFKDSIQYSWLGLTNDFDLYSKVTEQLYASGTIESQQDNFYSLFLSAITNGQWSIIQDILEQDCMQATAKPAHILPANFSILFGHSLRYIVNQITNIELFQEVITQYLPFESVLYSLLCILRFYMGDDTYEVVVDSRVLETDLLFDPFVSTRDKLKIVDRFKEAESAHTDTQELRFSNYIEIAPLKMHLDPNFAKDTNAAALVLLEWLDDHAFPTVAALEPYRCFTIVPCIKMIMGQVILNGSEEDLQSLYDFFHDRQWLIENDFAKFILPYLLMVAFHYSKEEVIPWLQGHMQPNIKITLSEIICFDKAKNQRTIVPNTQKISLWQYINSVLTHNSLQTNDLLKKCCVTQLAIIIRLTNSPNLHKTEKEMATKTLIAVHETNDFIAFASAIEYPDLFVRLLKRFNHPEQWLQQFAFRTDKNDRLTGLFRPILNVAAKSGDKKLISSLLCSAILTRRSSLLNECCIAIKKLQLEGDQRHLNHLKHESPLGFILSLIMQESDPQILETYIYYYEILAQFFDLTISLPNAVQHLASDYCARKTVLNEDLVTSLLGCPLEQYLLKGELTQNDLTKCALDNLNWRFFEKNPTFIPQFKPRRTLYSKLLNIHDPKFVERILGQMEPRHIFFLVLHGLTTENKGLEQLLRILKKWPNFKSITGVSLLHLACIFNNPSLFDLGLQYQAEINEPFHLPPALDFILIDLPHHNMMLPNELRSDLKWLDHLTPFEMAVIFNQTNFVKRIEKLKTKPLTNRFMQTSAFDPRLQGQSLLALASRANEFEIVDILLTLKLDPLVDYIDLSTSVRVQELLKKAIIRAANSEHLPLACLHADELPANFNKIALRELLAHSVRKIAAVDCIKESLSICKNAWANANHLLKESRGFIKNIKMTSKKFVQLQKDANNLDRSWSKVKSNEWEKSLTTAFAVLIDAKQALEDILARCAGGRNNAEHLFDLRTAHKITYQIFHPLDVIESARIKFQEYTNAILAQELAIQNLHKEVLSFKQANELFAAAAQPAPEVAPPVVAPTPALPKEKKRALKLKSTSCSSDSASSLSSCSSDSASSSSSSSTNARSPSAESRSNPTTPPNETISPMSISPPTSLVTSLPDSHEGSEMLVDTDELMVQNLLAEDAAVPAQAARHSRMMHSRALFTPGVGMSYTSSRRFFNVTGYVGPFTPDAKTTLNWPTSTKGV